VAITIDIGLDGKTGPLVATFRSAVSPPAYAGTYGTLAGRFMTNENVVGVAVTLLAMSSPLIRTDIDGLKPVPLTTTVAPGVSLADGLGGNVDRMTGLI
jgi:hypothetical protein